MLTKIALRLFSSDLKKVKYPGVLHEIKLEHCTDADGCIYIHLNTIKIKTPERNQGWGTLVMSDILKFADTQNVRVELYASVIFGSDIQRLLEFYERLGFTKITDDKDNKMYRLPRKLENVQNNQIVQNIK